MTKTSGFALTYLKFYGPLSDIVYEDHWRHLTLFLSENVLRGSHTIETRANEKQIKKKEKKEAL